MIQERGPAFEGLPKWGTRGEFGEPKGKAGIREGFL